MKGFMVLKTQQALYVEKLKDLAGRASTHIHSLAVFTERQPQPGIFHGKPRGFRSGCDIDHADRRRQKTAVERENMAAAGRNRQRHRERAERNLLSGGSDRPAARQQNGAIGLRPRRPPGGSRGRLGVNGGANKNRNCDQCQDW